MNPEIIPTVIPAIKRESFIRLGDLSLQYLLQHNSQTLFSKRLCKFQHQTPELMRPFLFFLLLFFMACKPESQPVTDPVVSVSVDAVYGQQPFALEEVYQVNENTFIRPVRLKFYMSKLEARLADGTWKPLKDAFLYDLDEQQTDFQISLPAGSDRLRLGIGVPPGINTGDPTVYDSNHPYSVPGSNGMHWNWNTGYRFIIYEGMMDTLQNGAFSQSFVFHTGTDTLYRTIDFPVTKGAVSATFAVDMSRVFNMIDLKKDNQTHGTGQLPLTTLFTENFLNAISVDYTVQ